MKEDNGYERNATLIRLARFYSIPGFFYYTNRPRDCVLRFINRDNISLRYR